MRTMATFKWFVYQPSTDTFSVAPHDLVVGDSITFSNVVRQRDSINITGTYTVTSIIDIYQFTITTGAGTLGIVKPFYCHREVPKWIESMERVIPLR